MSVSVQISDELAAKAETISEVFKRSLAGQIEYWAGIGHVLLPDRLNIGQVSGSLRKKIPICRYRSFLIF